MPQTTDAFFSTEITNHLFQKNQRRENFGLGKKKKKKINILAAVANGQPPSPSQKKLLAVE